MSRLKFQLVLPCYNEAKSLRRIVTRVIESAKRHQFKSDTFQLIVVQNGSRDGSDSVLDGLKKEDLGRWFTVVTVPVNQGYGHGLWEGLKTSTAPVIGWSHADEQCDPEDAFKAYLCLENKPRMVKGFRLGRESSKAFVSRAFERLAGWILGLNVREINAQPKVFPRSLLDRLKNPPQTFAFDLYAVYHATKAGLEIKEIDVLFPPRVHGQSNWSNSLFSRWRTILGMIRYMGKLAAAEGRVDRLSVAREVVTGVLRSPLFWVGIGIRLFCMPLFASYFLRDLSIPFIDSAVLDPSSNPWTKFPAHYFPYGIVLFFSLWVPKALGHFLVGGAALGDSWLSLTLMKTPLLLFDLGLLFTLARVVRDNKKEVLWFYWLNPLVIFISYVHGQLDVAAMFFASLSLVFLMVQRVRASAVLLAFATLCKFHVVLLLPLMAVYIWNHNFWRQAMTRLLAFGVVYSGLVAVGLLPAWGAHQLGHLTIASPEAARVFALKFVLNDELYLYLGPLALIMVFGRICSSTHITRLGLFLSSGILFGTLLMTTAAMPGWYFWVVPAFVAFFALHQNAPRSIFWMLSLLVTAHSLLLYHGEFERSLLGEGLLFTMVQGTLLGTLLTVWALSLRKELLLERRVRPFMIGIAGDSGSGKDHLTGVLSDLFSPSNTVVMEGDDYHYWERGNPNWNRFTHLDPRANDLALLKTHVSDILTGRKIQKATYSHKTGKFTEPRVIRPGSTLIVQGLHTLFLPSLRRKYDLKIFTSTEDSLRLAWKLRRDVKERGTTLQKAKQTLARRKKDSLIHIAPQRQHADWIIETESRKKMRVSDLNESSEVAYSVRHILSRDVMVHDVMERLTQRGCSVSLEYLPDDSDRMALTIAGELSAETVREICFASFSNIRQLTRSRNESHWRQGQDGILQIIGLVLLRHWIVEHRDKNENPGQTQSESNRRAA